MFKKGFKRYLPIIIAITVGLGIAGIAFFQLLNYTEQHQEMISIPVARSNLPPYVPIREKDIGWKSVVKGTDTNNLVMDPSQAVGKVPASVIYANEPISLSRLIHGEQVERNLITVSTDLVRCVGGEIKPGDLADIWWIVSLEDRRWDLVAQDAILVDIKDSANQSIFNGGQAPAIAVVAVQADDVPFLIGGSIANNNNIVLVKKYQPGSALDLGSTEPTKLSDQIRNSLQR